MEKRKNARMFYFITFSDHYLVTNIQDVWDEYANSVGVIPPEVATLTNKQTSRRGDIQGVLPNKVLLFEKFSLCSVFIGKRSVNIVKSNI